MSSSIIHFSTSTTLKFNENEQKNTIKKKGGLATSFIYTKQIETKHRFRISEEGCLIQRLSGGANVNANL